MDTDLQKKAILALDTAYEHGAVVLFKGEENIFSQLLPVKMAHGKEICGAIVNAIHACDKSGFALEGMLVGLGPGSFVGARIALATALGFSFARSLPLMGFCSHRALAHSHAGTHKRFFIYMKASGSLGYLTGYEAMDGALVAFSKTEVVSQEDIRFRVGDDAFIFSDQPSLLIQAEYIAGPTAEGVQRAALDKISTAGLVDESFFIKRNYIKPVSVSLPKKSFVIDHLAG